RPRLRLLAHRNRMMEGILSHMEPGRGQWPGVEASGDQRQVCDNGSKNGREGTMAKSACMPRQYGRSLNLRHECVTTRLRTGCYAGTVTFDSALQEGSVAERFIVNVEVIVERDGKYLLIVRSEGEEFGAGWLSFPGGKLETSTPDMQALELTAQRELKEEVGLDVALDDLRYVESHIFFIGEDPVLDVVMMTSAAIGEPVAVDP